MKAIELKYKAETGCDTCLSIETSLLTQAFDGVMFEGMSKREIIEAMDYDTEHNAKWGVFIDQIPKEIQGEDNDVYIHAPEYVEWLENELERLTTKTN